MAYGAAKRARIAYLQYVMREGLRLNRTAWEAGFLERNLPVPPDGPRDGYWGARIGVHVVDPELGWVLPKMHFPSLLETDSLGMQHVVLSGGAQLHLLIVGASTAFGGYASSIERTYFYQVAKQLEADRTPVEVTVYATGAWKSIQELKALRRHGLGLKPDVVLFLNGLNDLTNGSNARVLYGEQTATLDGSRWHPLYHEHDYDARVRSYLANMSAAYDDVHAAGIPLVVVLQPSLFEKRTETPLEITVERQSLQYYGDKEELRAAYASIRQGLAAIARRPGAYFIDCSRAFEAEDRTVFTDMWHFSDPGHAVLARAIAQPLNEILQRMQKGGSRSSLDDSGGASQ